MSKVKFKLDRAGVRELMRSPEAMNVVMEYATKIQSRCPSGLGYEVSSMVGANRVNASVFASTPEARRDNYENNTLLKARGGVK